MNPSHRRSPKNLTVNDVFPDWVMSPSSVDKGGIFYFLSAMNVPWETYTTVNGVTSHSITWQLDVLYHGEQSGKKFVSPMVYPYLDDEGELSSANAGYLAAAIAYKFREKWTHLWDLYHIQYSPLANYHMEETRERDATSDVDTTDTRTLNTKDTTTHPIKTVDTTTIRTPELTEKTDIDDSSTTETDRTDETTHGHVVTTGIQRAESGQANKFGFNSSEAVPVSTETGTVTETDTETNSGKDTTVIDGSETTTRDATDTKTTTGTDTVEDTSVETYTGVDEVAKTGTDTTVRDSGVVDHEEETVTKEGNLFKAPYEMLQGDRAFWMDDYFSIVFADIDSVLCLSIYPEREINTKVY